MIDKMKRSFNNKYIHALYTVLFTACIFLAFAIACHITPFGESTWLVFDMRRQYADFYSYYRTILNGTNNIFYSPAMTLGSAAVGFVTYYLTSPFLLITTLFDESRITVAITIMIGLKLALSAGSMDLFLKHYLKNHRSRTFMFAITYPLCAYVVSNSVNPMWLDVYMMMPIVLWMLDRLIEEKKATGYILSLAFTIWCNYYIAFMVCLFIIMWTIYRLIVLRDDAVKRLVRVGLYSILAVSLDMVLLLPTVFELGGSPKDIVQLGLKITKITPSTRETLSKLWVLAYNSSQPYFGTPLIYMGTIMVFLTVLYFANKQIALVQKLCMAGMMLIFFISFSSEKINLLWHAGMEPSGYPYREAFMLVFLCICCSCQCFNDFDNGIGLKQLLISIALVAFVFAFSITGGYQYINKRMVIINALLLCIISIGLLIYLLTKNSSKLNLGKYSKPLAGLMLIGFLFIQSAELLVNAVFIFRNQTNIGMTSDSDYQNAVTENSALVNIAKQDSGFYRIENMRPRQENDGMMHNYNAVTHYSSAGSIYTRFFLQDIGFNDDGLYTHFGNDNTCTADSLLGIRYLIKTGDKRKYYEYEANADVAKNPYALPVAGMINQKPINEKSNAFAYQEKIYSDIVGHPVNIFDNIICEDSILTDEEENNIQDGLLYHHYICKTNIDGYVYFDLDEIQKLTQNLMIYVDGELLTTYGNLRCMKVLNLGYHKADTPIIVDVKCDIENSNLGHAYIVTEDINKLAECYKEASQKGITLHQLSSSKYEMTIPEELSSQAGIFTTIPYNKDWKASINGKEIIPEMIYDTFLYLPVNEAGTVTITYVPDGMISGAAISILSLILIILIPFLTKKYTAVK